jgi:hypothetical protein
VVVRVKKRGTYKIHLGLIVAELICISAFIFEITRALNGNTLSWAYVFEWPLFGFYAVYMWRRMLRDERVEREGKSTPVVTGQADDPRLQAWNEYLTKVHATDRVNEPESKSDRPPER